jgi:hypothetical protein
MALQQRARRSQLGVVMESRRQLLQELEEIVRPRWICPKSRDLRREKLLDSRVRVKADSAG